MPKTPAVGVKETQAYQSALVTSAGGNGLNKIKSPLALADEIAMAPDIDSLKVIYNRVSMGLSSEDKQLFSNRKKELMS